MIIDAFANLHSHLHAVEVAQNAEVARLAHLDAIEREKEIKKWRTSKVVDVSAELIATGPFRDAELAVLRLLFNEDKIVETWRTSRPELAKLDPEPPIPLTGLPLGTFLIDLPFTLTSDLICKDDAQLHLLDNPVKKDRVHGYPEYWGPSWKGILRQAFLANHDFNLRAFKTPQAIRLFGNPKDESKDHRSGRLRLFTTRFDSIGFVVIHPSARMPKKPIPILIETVPPKTQGRFRLLYCPWDTAAADLTDVEADALTIAETIKTMFLLGIGAKSSAGFGTATIGPPAISTVGLPAEFPKIIADRLVAP